VKPRQVDTLEGRTFMVSDVRGDVDARSDEPGGLFYRDMRHLSRWKLLLNGRPLDALEGQATEAGQDR
jgi:N-terminal domain of (some) glycogen debranching enzymes